MTDNKRAADDAEREAFEAWYRKEIHDSTMYRRDAKGSDRFGEYCQWFHEESWKAWQARAALSSRADGGKDSSDARDAALKEAIKAIQDEITWRNGHGEYEYEKGLWAAIDELEELAKEPK
jgi:hypothetical protein